MAGNLLNYYSGVCMLSPSFALSSDEESMLKDLTNELNPGIDEDRWEEERYGDLGELDYEF